MIKWWRRDERHA